ncbi:MAG TPA: DUF1385 domain-containing protein [Clostridiales bacterium]|nr:DUF1385 domain-containing protein [Clostridiales bacterium]
MANKETENCEKFKTMIGGQALIEGIMMRGPEKDAIVIRGKDGLTVEVTPRKLNPPGSWKTWPFIRGIFNFFDAQIVGVKALLRSADLAPDEMQEEPSKFDKWLEKKLGSEAFQKAIVGIAVAMGLLLSIGLFFLLPMVIGGFFDKVITSTLLLNLVEGVIRMVIFIAYMILISRMPDMKRVFSYHGAEHKTIRCYEAGLPLTVENVRQQTRLHPRCGTSFLLVVMVISILVFSVASSALLAAVPALETIRGTFGYRLLMIVFKLLLLPLVVGITYEINRWAGRHDNGFTKILTAPGMWLQHFTTNEPDDSMIQVGIAALEAVLPEREGADRW